MERAAELWLPVALFLAVAITLGWRYMVWRRISHAHGEARGRLQSAVVEALRDTRQGRFLFVLSYDARNLEVQLDAHASELQHFEQILAAKLDAAAPETKFRVVPLERSLEHLPSGVVIWGKEHGDVHVARDRDEDAA
jgi:hypothetical protein